MAKMQVDRDLIRDLAELLNETDLTEIEVEDGERKIKISRNSGTVQVAQVAAPAAPVAVAAAAPAAEAPLNPETNPGTVFSPMVGSIYTAPDPASDEFIKVGDTVAAGQTIFIIEAMKVMNQIHAAKGGVVKEIFVKNAQPVEYGEALVIIE